MPQTAFTSGPLTPATAADAGGGGLTWNNVNNAKVEDGLLADCFPVGPGGGGGFANQLKTTGLGFAIPSNAVIDGIKLEVKARADISSNPNVFLLYNGGNTAPSTVSNPFWQNTLQWLTYGSATDKWGRSWTPAEINHANFGASMSAFPGTGTWTIAVDSVRITVYWHYSNDVAPADVPTRYLYKAFNAGIFLGCIPNVTSKFGFSLDINSAGSSINIECGVSADSSREAGSRITTEAGDPITTEAGEYIYTDGQPPLIGLGNSLDPRIIQNGNTIQVWEYSYYYPNGKLMFVGQVNEIDAGMGSAADNKVKMTVLSDGIDLDNIIARGAPFNYTADVTQTSQNAAVTVSAGSKGGMWNKYGQSLTVGAGISKYGAVAVLLNGAADVTMTVYDGPNGNIVGSVTQTVDTAGAAVQVLFGVASLIGTSPGSTLFFDIGVGAGQSIQLYYSNANPYAGGQMYNSNYGGGSGGGSFSPVVGSDLYFISYQGTATTTATYSSKDPATGMLQPIIDDYRLRGGAINYAPGTVDATGLSLTATFNTETILDAIKKCLDLSPSGFYFYVDLGTDTIYFKRTLTTPTYRLIKGRHLTNLNLVMSIVNIKNDLLFSGATIAGTNLYTEYSDPNSRALYGNRLERKSDNRVSLQATADAIGTSFIAERKDEYFETTVTIAATTMDITAFKPGQTVGLRGFGTFIDTLLLQITRLEYSPESVTLTLGTLPKRFTDDFEQVIRGLVAEQTVANPSAPS